MVRIQKENHIQIELHPGHHCFGMSCSYCHGSGLKKSSESLSLEEYQKFIRSIPFTGVHFEISGLYADPLSYDHILPLTEYILTRGHSVSFTTKGLGPLKDIAVLLSQYYSERNSITLSIDASSGSEYRKIHTSPAKLFDVVYRNIREASQAIATLHRHAQLRASFRLFKGNSGLESVSRFIRVFSEYVDSISFVFPDTLPHRPLNEDLLDTEGVNATLSAIEKVYTEKVTVKKHNPAFNSFLESICKTKGSNFVIAEDGFVYPCSKLASPQFPSLQLGNIKHQDYLSIWESKTRKSQIEAGQKETGCSSCDKTTL